MKDNEMIVNLPEPYSDINFYRRKKNWKMDTHTHTYYQLIYILDGVLEIRDSQKTYTLTPNKLCIIPPKWPHFLSTPCGYRQFGINMSEMRDCRGLISMLYSNIRSLTIVKNPGVRSSVSEIWQEEEPLITISRLKTACLADSLIISCMESIIDIKADSFRKKLPILLKNNLSKKLTLKQISREMALSQTHLERLCKKEFGCGAIELFNRIKIERACFMLLNKNMSIKNIAWSLGFCDQAYFSKAFKKRMEVTPGKFREQSD